MASFPFENRNLFQQNSNEILFQFNERKIGILWRAGSNFFFSFVAISQTAKWRRKFLVLFCSSECWLLFIAMMIAYLLMFFSLQLFARDSSEFYANENFVVWMEMKLRKFFSVWVFLGMPRWDWEWENKAMRGFWDFFIVKLI